MKIKVNSNFSLIETVTCGQIFRFFLQEDGSYDIILKDRIINVSQKGNYLTVFSNNNKDLLTTVTNYFNLNNDYDYIDNFLIKSDKKIEDAVIKSRGMNLINQDPFEVCISYIVSANNSVLSISKSINEIARRWGEKVLFDDKTYYLFPEYCALKDVSIQEYKECKVGFRDKYIYNFVKRVNDNQSYLQSIYSLSTDEALLSLMQSPGIGPKVASCILLFAYQKYDVFPVDTWVKKIFKNIYGIENESNIRAFAKKTYGKYSGVAIQYLFHTSRNK